MRFDMYGGHHGSSEELGLFLHVVALPQRQPVKLLDRHSKHVKEQLRSQVALERERERKQVKDNETEDESYEVCVCVCV